MSHDLLCRQCGQNGGQITGCDADDPEITEFVCVTCRLRTAAINFSTAFSRWPHGNETAPLAVKRALDALDEVVDKMGP